jgi:hypothetical protein
MGPVGEGAAAKEAGGGATAQAEVRARAATRRTSAASTHRHRWTRRPYVPARTHAWQPPCAAAALAAAGPSLPGAAASPLATPMPPQHVAALHEVQSLGLRVQQGAWFTREEGCGAAPQSAGWATAGPASERGPGQEKGRGRAWQRARGGRSERRPGRRPATVSGPPLWWSCSRPLGRWAGRVALGVREEGQAASQARRRGAARAHNGTEAGRPCPRPARAAGARGERRVGKGARAGFANKGGGCGREGGGGAPARPLGGLR